jgi:hypothetical protein
MPLSATSEQAANAAAHGQQYAATGADRDDDEDHFKPFQQHRLEACETGQPVEPLLVSPRLFAQFCRFAGEGGCLVVQRNDSGRAQYRLAQPAHAEQQEQNANRDLQHIERHAIKQPAQGDNNEREHEKARDRAETGRPPAAHDGDGKHDGQSLDRFDQRGQKRRRDGRSGVQIDHLARLMLRDSREQVS